ncbi:MAG: cob(I)yrinic acid a,c-diamide adenosyltransferase, partial [Candidatus Woesearchaeota archaeon]
LGNNMRVLYCQFFKFETGEKVLLSKLPNLEYLQFNVPSEFFKDYDAKHHDDVKKKFILFWQDILDRIRSEKHDIIILDEIVYAVSMNLAPITIITELIKNKPDNIEIIMTGRNYPKEVLELADYVSDIRLVKHPFNDKQIEARKGVEY